MNHISALIRFAPFLLLFWSPLPLALLAWTPPPSLSSSLSPRTGDVKGSPTGITLARDGRPAAVILLSSSPTAEEQLAAEELQTYLRKISGATLPISAATAAAAATATAAVRIAVDGTGAAKEWRDGREGGQQQQQRQRQQPPPPPDGFIIETRGDTLWIIGGDGRGALYGVYQLLEDLGVRWFMPGELGEDITPRRTVTLPPQRGRRGAPGFRAVSGLIWAGGPGAREWERRIRAQIGPPSAFFGHNWENIIAAKPETKAAHPEWFALHKGERINQLCTTHPDVVRITIDKAREFFNSHPEALTFSISPNDGDKFCECERCRALDRRYGVTDDSVTDRFVHYANQVLVELSKTHPGKQIGILAYVQHTRPPVSARPHPNFATLICHTPWEFCHVHPLDAPECARNRRFLEYVAGWTKISRHVGVYDYYGHFYVFAPWPIVHSIRRDIPLLRRLGVERFQSETQQHWANQGLNFYVAAKLLWDPNQDADALLAEYYERFYGRAAVPMRRYWERWERAMIETAKNGDGGYRWLVMFTPELIAECDRYLARAAELAAHDDREKIRGRVALARQGFRFTEAWARMRNYGDRSDFAAAVAAGEEAIRRLEETAGTEPQAFWIWLAKTQTESQLESYRKGRRPEE